MSDNRLVLIDGYGFLFRAYYALPPLTRKDGTPVGAVYGFTTMLLKLLASAETSHIAVVLDSGKKSFRNKMYKEYKANRPPAPEDLRPQFPLIREVVKAFDIPVLEKVGYEADDIIGTLAQQGKKKGMDVVVVSSDKDLMQLVEDNVCLYDPMKQKTICEKEVFEKFGVKPEQVIDLLALMGDSSDNVPGVAGIGPKTAATLLNEFSTLDGIYENLPDMKKSKRKENLERDKEMAYLSRDLVSLELKVPLDEKVSDLKRNPINPVKLMKFLRKQDFISLLKRIGKTFNVDAGVVEEIVQTDLFEDKDGSGERGAEGSATTLRQASAKPKKKIKKQKKDKSKRACDIVTSLETIQKIVDNAKWNGYLCISVETFGSTYRTPIECVSVMTKDGDLYYIPTLLDKQKKAEEAAPTVDLFGALAIDDKVCEAEKEAVKSHNFLKESEVFKALKEAFEDDSILKVGYDMKKLINILWNHNIELISFEDISVISYILDAGRKKHELSELIKNNNIFDYVLQEDFLPYKDAVLKEFSDIIERQEKGKELDSALEAHKKEAERGEILRGLAEFKVIAIDKLYYDLKHRLYDENMMFIYERFERPVTKVLADMERNGLRVDLVKMKELSGYFEKRIRNLEKEIHKEAGVEFNIGSPKQLGEILFDKMKLPAGGTSKKTGQRSTNVKVLEKLDEMGFEIAGKILDWRHCSKLKNTYTDILPDLVDKETGRVYTTFSNTTTNTGRLSSNNPNLQNIPIRGEDSKKIREAFVPEKGHKLISADYSQIELRVLSHFGNIKEMQEAFKSGEDIHAATASQVFDVPKDKVTSELRRRAKAINFGIVYGISAYGLAKQINVPTKEASAYIKAYFEKYPGIKEYMDSMKEFAKKYGYVKTIFGRKCHLPEIKSKNPTLRSFAERVAINAPMQGTAADIIKKAMVDLHEAMKKGKFKAKLVLQVHDELIIEAPNDEVKKVTDLLTSTMSKAISLDVPLDVDYGVGKDWSEIH